MEGFTQSQCDLVNEAVAALVSRGYRRYASGARPVPRYIERSARVLEFVHDQGLMAGLAKVLEL